MRSRLFSKTKKIGAKSAGSDRFKLRRIKIRKRFKKQMRQVLNTNKDLYNDLESLMSNLNEAKYEQLNADTKQLMTELTGTQNVAVNLLKRQFK